MPETTHNNRQQAGALLGLHALTSLHPGSGTALGTVDLPIQRERHTHWPTIAGSALKGVLRDAVREKVKTSKNHSDDPEASNGKRKTARNKADAEQEVVAIFGPPTASDSSDSAGALSVTDARIVAYPVRSLKGVFAWVTCPAVLQRLKRDAALAGCVTAFPIPNLQQEQCIVPNSCPCLAEQSLVLEEFEFTKAASGDVSLAALWIAEKLLPADDSYKSTADRMKRQLVLLHEDDFTHFVRYATEITARIALDYNTKTVKKGALFYQEFLPTESVLYSVVLMNASRAKQGSDALGLMTAMRNHLPPILQIGADETTGKGYCGVRLGEVTK